MTVIRKSALVPYSADAMYGLVADVERYREFLPWCGGARVLTHSDDTLTASVDIAYRGVHKSFTTRNRLDPGRSMEMQLVDGPFRKLHGYWRFEPLDAEACKVTFELDFEFSSRLLGMMIGPVFESIANGMVDGFRSRAEALYGKR